MCSDVSKSIANSQGNQRERKLSVWNAFTEVQGGQSSKFPLWLSNVLSKINIQFRSPVNCPFSYLASLLLQGSFH